MSGGLFSQWVSIRFTRLAACNVFLRLAISKWGSIRFRLHICRRRGPHGAQRRSFEVDGIKEVARRRFILLLFLLASVNPVAELLLSLPGNAR